MNHPRYTERTVQWGHWGIVFMEPQPDRTKNYGVIVGRIEFGVGPCGPIDGTIGSPTRQHYKAMCDEWISGGNLPNGAVSVA